MILSILIPTVKGREDKFKRLESFILKQIVDLRAQKQVEIISLCDNKEISIGEKRNRLYSMATGLYSWQIDDDDSIHHNAIALILGAAMKGSDCIGFKELCVFNGKKVESSNFSLRYNKWQDNFDGFNHVRTPFCKTPIITHLCKTAVVPDMRFGEDHEFSKRIYPLLKTETYIDEFIYIYQYTSESHNLKYGIK